MSKVFTPSELTSDQAHVSSMDSYQKRYQDSISDPESFWAEIAQRLDWMEPWASVRKFDFVNAKLNGLVAENSMHPTIVLTVILRKGMEMKRLSFGKGMTQINLESLPIMIY